jgi:anaerobic selenocysteine-containing dehydrogenase
VAGDPGADGCFAVAPPDVIAELGRVITEGDGAAALAGWSPADFPFRLASRRLKHVLNSLGRELSVLARAGTTNAAHIHPDDLAELGLRGGDLVRITSPHGEIVGVAAAADDVKRGVVSMSHAWGTATTTDDDVRVEGVATNRLVATDDGYDPITGMAVQSAIPVRVDPA